MFHNWMLLSSCRLILIFTQLETQKAAELARSMPISWCCHDMASSLCLVGSCLCSLPEDYLYAVVELAVKKSFNVSLIFLSPQREILVYSDFHICPTIADKSCVFFRWEQFLNLISVCSLLVNYASDLRPQIVLFMLSSGPFCFHGFFWFY